MTHASAQPGMMRLVGACDEQRLADWVNQREARLAIARENQAAAANPALNPTDPRWVLAAQTQAQLQGATLTPEHRQRLMKTAKAIGVRPFDANLIIAIVQDHARCGQSLQNAHGVLAMVRQPRRRTHLGELRRWALAALAAIGASLLLIWLLLA